MQFKSTEIPIGGFQTDYDDAKYVVFGVEYDRTASYREGCGMAPDIIRETANNLETVDMFTSNDIGLMDIHDMGNLQFTTRENLFQSIREVLTKIRNDSKIPLILGGEHTITAATAHNFKNSLYVMLDAHSDLRESYNGDRWSHACAARRLLDIVDSKQLVQFGIRALSMEENEFAESNNIIRFFSHNHSHEEAKKIVETVNRLGEFYDGVYLTLDMDGFDPAFVPGVGNPEPLGLTTREVFSIISQIKNIVGMDITELNPKYDSSGSSQVVAARLAMHLLSR